MKKNWKELIYQLWFIVNAAEPIRHDSHQKFAERFKKYGLNPHSLAGMYGMAEVTLGLTLTEPGKPITEISVDRNELSRGIVKLAEDEFNSKGLCFIRQTYRTIAKREL